MLSKGRFERLLRGEGTRMFIPRLIYMKINVTWVFRDESLDAQISNRTTNEVILMNNNDIL